MLNIPPPILKPPINHRIYTNVPNRMVIFNQLNIKKKYMIAVVSRNNPPKNHFFHCSSRWNNILIKRSNTHIAHGLKPSNPPNSIANNGNDTLFASTSPKNGKLTLDSSLIISTPCPGSTIPNISPTTSRTLLSLTKVIASPMVFSVEPSLNPTITSRPIIKVGVELIGWFKSSPTS